MNLAISLHAATQEEREALMPVARAYKLPELLEACREHAEITGRRVSFEYTLIAGKNDSPEDAKKLEQLIIMEHANKAELITDIGPVIGAHSGPGTLAVFFVGTQR